MAAALVVWLLLVAAAPAGAQTSDDLFDDNVVHDVKMWIHSADWLKLKEDFRLNDYYPADLEWRGIVVRNVGIRSRGSGSRSGTKPGLRVDFDRYSGSQELLGLKSIVLDNLTQDPSMIKERVAMRFYQRMGYPAPRVANARLFVNGEYAGLYAIVESIDKSFLRRVFGVNASGSVENDGYLYEYKWLDNYQFQYLGGELEQYAARFEAKTHEHDSMTALYGPFEEMIRTINGVRDEDFAAAVSSYLDLDVFMRYIAIDSFLADYDGFLGFYGVNNFYFYRFEKQTRGQLLPWDRDSVVYSTEMDVFQGASDNILMRRALAVPEVRSAYLGWVMACAQSASEPAEPDSPSGWLEREMIREVDQIRSFAYADRFKPFSNAQFDDEVAKLMNFARDRARTVLQQVTPSTLRRR